MLLFGRQLSARKWFALVLLTAGVVLVQMQGSAAHHKSSSGGLLHKVNEDARNTAVGLLAVLVACLLSGFSGCYFEWYAIFRGMCVSMLAMLTCIFMSYAGFSKVRRGRKYLRAIASGCVIFRWVFQVSGLRLAPCL